MASDHFPKSSVEYEHVGFSPSKISMAVPKTLLAKVKKMEIKSWSTTEPDISLPDIDVCNMEMFSTDLYELSSINKTEARGIQDINDMIIKVPLVYNENGQQFKYRSHIHYENKWSSTEATYYKNSDGQFVTFRTQRLESFFITRLPPHEKFIFKKEGNTFTSSKDDRIQVKFPKDAVDNATEVEFTLYPIDSAGMEWRLKNTPQKCNILAMSDCLYVKSNITKLKQRVSVQLPIDKTVAEECELVSIHWKRDEPQIIANSSDRKIEKVEQCYTVSVDSFSGHQIAVIQPGSQEQITHQEIKLNAGREKQCKFLVFIRKENLTCFTLRVDIVPVEKIEETIRTRASMCQLTELPKCRSADENFVDKQRIRVEVSGNARYAFLAEKNANILRFLQMANDCFLDILLQMHNTMFKIPFTTISFSNCSKERRHLFSTYFNPERVLFALKKTTKSPSEDFPAPIPNGSSEKEAHSEQSKAPMTSTNPTTSSESPSEDSSSKDEGFFSDKSMLVLASKLPSQDALQFGVYLGLGLETVKRLQDDTQNVNIFHLKILKKWLSIKTSSNKLSALSEALKHCGLHNLDNQLQMAFKKGRMLKDEDFA